MSSFRIQSNVSLKKYSTFKIGGAAKYFAAVTNIDECRQALLFARERRVNFLVIGNGSNSLFDDRGYKGLVIHNNISFFELDGVNLHVGAGYNFSHLGAKISRGNLSGLEFASGIPGTVGGAVFMNAGAGGQETKDTLEQVQWIDSFGKMHLFEKKELNFEYRKSDFQQKKGIIFSAKFKLAKSDAARKNQIQKIKYRLATQPYKDSSVGCIFKNPTGDSAGAIIEKLKLKGKRVGGASISSVHGNFIINDQGASAKDVVELAKQIQVIVQEKSGISLELELKCAPYE